MADFYRKDYTRIKEGYEVYCSKEDATQVVVRMPSIYGFQSTIYEAKFKLPDQERDLRRFEDNLRRAFELGQNAKAAEVAHTLNSLLKPEPIR